MRDDKKDHRGDINEILDLIYWKFAKSLQWRLMTLSKKKLLFRS